MKTRISAALALLATSILSNAAPAEPLPGMRGVNHIGMTVPDMQEAVGFFTDVLGCEKAMSFGPFRDDTGTFMQDVLNVNPRAVIEQITMMRCGFGSNIELFKYTSRRPADSLSEEQRCRRVSCRDLCRRHRQGGRLFQVQGRQDAGRPAPGH